MREAIDLADRGVELSAGFRVGRCALASSRRKRRPVRGVRSWCEASATNSRCAANRRATRSVISLNERESERCSGCPRPQRAHSGRPARRAVRPPRAGGAAGSLAGNKPPASRPSASTLRAISTSRLHADTALCTAATLWVTRTAPAVRRLRTIGTAVARISCPSVFEARSTWTWRPSSAEDLRPAVVAHAHLRRAGAVGQHDATRIHDEHAAPDRCGARASQRAQLRSGCGPRRSAAVAATRSACASA